MGTQGITPDLADMLGKPVVEVTRVTVESILEELRAGQTIQQLLEAHPRLSREGVPAQCVSGPKSCVRTSRDR